MDVNVTDYPYNAQPLIHRIAGLEGSVSTNRIYEDGAFTEVEVGDTLWIQSGVDMGKYGITEVDSSGNYVGVDYEAWTAAIAIWKITAGPAYDCTSAFQNAIDDVHAAGGGIVYVPTGYFFLEDSLTVHGNVVVKGMWDFPPRWSGSAWTQGDDQGPVLCPISSMGDDGAYGSPFITLSATENNAGVEGLQIYYPLQGIVSNPQSHEITMMPYPFCISIDTSGGTRDHRIRNVMLVNPYEAIKVVGGGTRVHISGVHGCALKSGIMMDGVTDFCAVEKVHFHPDFWPIDLTEWPKSLRTFLAKNLIVMELGRMDGFTMDDVKAWMMNKGLVLRASIFEGGAWFTASNVKFDVCNVGIEASGGQGMLTNCELIAGTQAANRDAYVYDYDQIFNMTESIHATGANFLNFHGATICCSGEGKVVNWNSGGWLSIANTLFINNPDADIDYGVYANAGKVFVHGCRFQYNGGHGYTECVHLTSGVEKGMVFGNDYLSSAPGSNSAMDRETFVSGQIKVQTQVGNSGVILQSTSAGNTPFLTFKDHSETTAKTYSMRYNTSDEKLYIGEGEASFSSQVTIARATGNMGVGTMSPGEKLEVNGNIKVGSDDAYLIGSVKILSGTGSPSGIEAPIGSLYLRADSNGSLYRKYGNSNTDWVAFMST